MFFSIIIPTYNPKKDLPRLLNSILCNQCIDDIEIIISDDCSVEPFDDVLNSFKSLNIKQTVNEFHTGFPRNGRSNGSKITGGKWICFADQDDFYIDNAFDKIKKYIEENEISNYLATPFIMHVEGTEQYTVKSSYSGWTHGKFFEADFWRRYNIDYDDVQYCEDINLMCKIGCTAIVENIPMNQFEEPIYIWVRKENCLSDGAYFLKSIPDYIKGTVGVITDYIEMNQYNNSVVNELSIKFIHTLYHLYFYFQSDLLSADRLTVLNSAIVLYPYYERFKAVTKINTKDIIEKTNGELRGLFAETRADDYIQSPFVERMTFSEWVKAYLN